MQGPGTSDEVPTYGGDPDVRNLPTRLGNSADYPIGDGPTNVKEPTHGVFLALGSASHRNGFSQVPIQSVAKDNPVGRGLRLEIGLWVGYRSCVVPLVRVDRQTDCQRDALARGEARRRDGLGCVLIPRVNDKVVAGSRVFRAMGQKCAVECGRGSPPVPGSRRSRLPAGSEGAAGELKSLGRRGRIVTRDHNV
jgi:hypothetical protein